MVQALWRWADATSAAAASGYVADPDPRVHAAAIYALARKPRDAALPVLTQALQDGDPDTARDRCQGPGAARQEGIARSLGTAW